MILPLESVLNGREERALKQRELLLSMHESFSAMERDAGFICQIALNVPGYPKRITNDEEAVCQFTKLFLDEFEEPFIKDLCLINGAGYCWIGVFEGDREEALRAKMCAVELEERLRAGRVFDIDIITKDGAISRKDVGLPPRKCFFCGNDAKICSKERAHYLPALRNHVVLALLEI